MAASELNVQPHDAQANTACGAKALTSVIENTAVALEMRLDK
jgi:hypothetical protein